MAGENLASVLQRSKTDPEQFVHFYSECFDGILAFLMRRLGDAEVALDLASETFAQAYVARHRFRGQAEPEAVAWIYRIAKRQLARYLRRGRLEMRAVRKLGITVPTIDDDQASRIEQLADLEGLKAGVRSELALLSSAQQEALQLRIVEEMPYAAVAERLQISEQAARLRVSRGLAALAKGLDGNPTVKEFAS